MILTGALVNLAAVIAGSLVGIGVGKLLPERLGKAAMSAVALVTIGIAVPGLLKSQKPLVPILSMVLGTLLGEAINIDGLFHRLGDKLKKKTNGHGNFTEGFVTGSLVFAVGAMAIMGGLDSGLSGDHTLLLAKSVIDGISAVIFASTLGIGVAFSGLTVFVLEGGVALLASLLAPVLTSAVMGEITFVGSLLILGVSLNILGVTKLRLLNMIPALLFPPLLCQIL